LEEDRQIVHVLIIYKQNANREKKIVSAYHPQGSYDRFRRIADAELSFHSNRSGESLVHDYFRPAVPSSSDFESRIVDMGGLAPIRILSDSFSGIAAGRLFHKVVFPFPVRGTPGYGRDKYHVLQCRPFFPL
jgi:hypothetical protein